MSIPSIAPADGPLGVFLVGLGAVSSDRGARLFNWSRAELSSRVAIGAWEHGRLELAFGERFDRFGATPIVTPLTQSSPEPATASFTFGQVRIFVDSRPIGRPGVSGARANATIETAVENGRHPARNWVMYECDGSLFWEVMRPGRVLELHAHAAFADSLSGEPVPYMSLVTLGGADTMRGWWAGRFRGESVLSVSASYRYPIWHSLDGMLALEAGNAFARHLSDFDVQRLRGSLAIGFRSTGSRDTSVDVVLAVGTSRFDTPLAIDSFRVAVGFNGEP